MFDIERNQHFPLELPQSIQGQIVPLETYFEVEDALEPQVFPDNPNIQRHFSIPHERRQAGQRLSNLQRQTHQETIVFYDDNIPIGWFAGRMENASEFLMDVTGILPTYQGKGIYSAFLKAYLPYYRQLTVVITAYQPADTISVGKLNYHVPVSRSAALRVGGNGRCLAIVIRPSGFSAPYGRR